MHDRTHTEVKKVQQRKTTKRTSVIWRPQEDSCKSKHHFTFYHFRNIMMGKLTKHRNKFKNKHNTERRRKYCIIPLWEIQNLSLDSNEVYTK
mmetsp:Transcript_28800/g.42805  ORF Transcript_28800/g.42805 Transcript_28800/m.42805 type:complete len:92 (+) Transcript_28800:400-675(+)